MAPSWFPNWTGQTAVVVGSGPSLTVDDVQACADRGAKIIAVNDAWAYAPNDAVLYACDWSWWVHKAPHPADFKGLRIRGSKPTDTQARQIKPMGLYELAMTNCVTCANDKLDPLQWEGDRVANGGNGGLQAANLAARFGAKRIVLLGIDCNAPNSHFNGGAHQFPGAAIQGHNTIKGFIKAWNMCAPQFKAHGVEVINANRGSMVECFPKRTIAHALA
jgi:hypothetical protein